MLTKTYHSPHRGLIINAEPKVPRIEFVEGVFTTSDPRQMALLEKRQTGFGRYVFLEKVTGQVEEEEAEVEEETAEFVCPVAGCERTFASKAALSAHLGAHKRKGEL